MASSMPWSSHKEALEQQRTLEPLLLTQLEIARQECGDAMAHSGSVPKEPLERLARGEELLKLVQQNLTNAGLVIGHPDLCPILEKFCGWLQATYIDGGELWRRSAVWPDVHERRCELARECDLLTRPSVDWVQPPSEKPVQISGCTKCRLSTVLTATLAQSIAAHEQQLLESKASERRVERRLTTANATVDQLQRQLKKLHTQLDNQRQQLLDFSFLKTELDESGKREKMSEARMVKAESDRESERCTATKAREAATAKQAATQASLQSDYAALRARELENENQRLKARLRASSPPVSPPKMSRSESSKLIANRSNHGTGAITATSSDKYDAGASLTSTSGGCAQSEPEPELQPELEPEPTYTHWSKLNILSITDNLVGQQLTIHGGDDGGWDQTRWQKTGLERHQATLESTNEAANVIQVKYPGNTELFPMNPQTSTITHSDSGRRLQFGEEGGGNPVFVNIYKVNIYKDKVITYTKKKKASEVNPAEDGHGGEHDGRKEEKGLDKRLHM